MNDEKYISIPFDKWENYYKKLEEINKKLEDKLTGEVRIVITHNYIKEFGLQGIYGLINISTGKTNLIDYQIQNVIEDYIRKLAKYKVHILTEEDFNSTIEKLKQINLKIDEDKEIISKIPKLVKWIFKIKE